jgi:F-type H+-transporting ATPase subunit b
MNELIYGSLAFIVLLVFMIWKGLPALKKGMEGRTERIRTDLATAEQARAEAEGVLAQYQQQVASSKGEATRIIEDARATAEATKAELHKRAEAEVAEMKQRAAADIESSKAQAISDLKGQVAALAIGAAEVVVEKSLDPATQTQLIENYINQVTASAN